VLDIDDTDDAVHGQQQLALFNTHAGGYCFQPIKIFEATTGRPVLSLLHPGKRPSGEEVEQILRHVRRCRRLRGGNELRLWRSRRCGFQRRRCRRRSELRTAYRRPGPGRRRRWRSEHLQRRQLRRRWRVSHLLLMDAKHAVGL
jgi:hypothetical protein